MPLVYASKCLASSLAVIIKWTATWGIKLEYVQLGKPQQSVDLECFNRTVPCEWLFRYYWAE
jgi:hypothetical protein